MVRMSEPDDFDQVIQSELDKLDRWFAPETPDEASFQRLVVLAKAEQRRRLKRDLFLFSGVAALSVAAGLAGLAYHPAVYGVIQGALFIGFTLWMTIAHKKRAGSS